MDILAIVAISNQEDIDFNITCLAAGNTKGMYRSSSLLLYNESGTIELVMQCTDGEWSNASSMSVSASNVTSVKREDCVECVHTSSSQSGASCKG